MGHSRYSQPESCRVGENYYGKIDQNGSGASYQPVRFLGYRPHPGEVLVHDGQRPRVIHRYYLYQKSRPFSSAASQ